ncbi:MAG: electron transfer flavoprotein subunit beta/FixA family protein [Candidatus Thermoplasmatota archaeon]
MKIIVCVKQVPDTTEVRIDPKTGTLIREGVPSIVNPDDKHAVEEALRLKEEHGGTVTAISMGPPQADEALREVSAMGVDDVVLLCDRAFAGADTLATSYALATCIKKLEKFDLVLCGREAIDGDTAQIGPQIAEYLGIPQITYVRSLELKGKKVVCERALEDGYEVIEARLPALLTVIKEINTPRFPTVRGIVEAYREKEVKVWGAGDIGADPMQIGLNGSPTSVHRSFAPEPKGKGVVLDPKAGELANLLLEKLLEKNVLR